RYGRPGKGNDKGNVEGMVGYARRNHMVPIPCFSDWDAFNSGRTRLLLPRRPAVLDRSRASSRWNRRSGNAGGQLGPPRCREPRTRTADASVSGAPTRCPKLRIFSACTFTLFADG
ncbi:hypothetical protein E1B25_21345, partial [Antarcticimicrobium sediminis]